jgi:hypothetical protein
MAQVDQLAEAAEIPNVAFYVYDPRDHYWRADDGRIYSSKAQALVADNDHAYQEWLATPRIPTAWPVDENGAQTDAALNDVLAPFGLQVG